jgi:hypothetical protein
MNRAGRLTATVALIGWGITVSWARQASGPEGSAPASSVPRTSASARAEFLTMFARGYFPGRTGQILIVPREGTILTRPEASVLYMHGSPWPYDRRIPILFAGAGVTPGVYRTPAVQQDVAVTVASALGVAMPRTATGKVLPGIRPMTPRPRIVFLLVLDGMRLDYFDRHAQAMPTLSGLRRRGAWFTSAGVNYLPTNTGAGHASIATGSEPRVHGITGNNLYDRVSRERHDTLDEWNPRDLVALTLSDVWQLHAGRQARVIAQGSSKPASVSLAGHGACQTSGFPTVHAAYDESSGVWKTDPNCFTLPHQLDAFHARDIFPPDGLWMGHQVGTVSEIRRSALFSAFEADTFIRLLETQGVGDDAVTDLLLLNYKTADYVGHKHGPESPELVTTLGELDRNLARILKAIEERVGQDWLIALTSDHGMPAAPPPAAGRYFAPDIIRALHARFDPGAQLIPYYEPENAQIFVDQERLVALGLTLKDLTAFLETQPYVFAAFTEDEVRREAATLR